MKIAVLSDIHSNVYALKAVIDHATAQQVDRMVNLGDILYGPIAPKATYDLLMKHEFTTISGNQDRQIIEATQEHINANSTLQFILEDLGDKPLDWLRSLPFDQQLTDEIYLCHGSPLSDMVYLLENIESGSPSVRSDQNIIQLLGEQQSELILCGHTHLPRIVQLSTDQLVINPGSVGLQAYCDEEPFKHCMENYNSFASYSIIEKEPQGWVINQLSIPYDFDSAIKDCKKRKRSDWAHYCKMGRK